MDQVGVLLGSMALFGITVHELLRNFEKKARKGLHCRTCGLSMNTAGPSKFMPGEVSRFLDQYNLPAIAASRFTCPKGHYQLWFIPKFGNTERAFFLKEEL